MATSKKLEIIYHDGQPDGIRSVRRHLSTVTTYEAYQLLDNEWSRIAVDLEIIQTEGFDATKKVDPNMVVKKKDGKDTEVQDGWIGHVIPFELAQRKHLSDKLSALKANETRLAEIAAEFEELLDELPEEEKEKDFVNDDKTAFVAAAVKKAIKAKEVEPEILDILKRVDNLVAEEKATKKKVKDDSAALHLETKAKIEELSDADVKELLKDKWIAPVVNGLAKLPENIVNEFVSKLEALAKKYETTFFEVEEEIRSVESSLTGMLDQLTGNDYDMKGLAEFKKLLGGE